MPFVVGYGVLAALPLRYLGFQDFFWWSLALSSAFFFVCLRTHLGSKDALAEFAQLQEREAQSIEAAATWEEAIRELSPTRQLRQHVAVPVIVFIVSYSLTFYLIKPSTF